VSFTTLVDAATLHARLSDPQWVIVDCRHALADFALGRKLYDEAHIPGAFFAEIENDLSGTKTGTNGRHPLPNPADFTAFLRTLGVSEETQVVAYDAGGDMFAARLWFLCKWIGHDAVAVLDGGLSAWTAAGYETTAEFPSEPERGAITANMRPELIVDSAFVASHLHDPKVCIIDARAADRFAGKNETIDPIAGHIPGACNRWFKDIFREDLTVRSPEELHDAFDLYGEPADIVHQCGSGISAANNMLAMEHAGLHGSRVYAGSWSEWIADPSHPIATGS